MTDSKQPDDEGPASDFRESIQAEFDWSDVTPSTAVVETVAIAANREPIELEPLYETIEPNAFDTLIRSRGPTPTDRDATISFALDGHEVTVQRDGTVVVRPDAARTEPE